MTIVPENTVYVLVTLFKSKPDQIKPKLNHNNKQNKIYN